MIAVVCDWCGWTWHIHYTPQQPLPPRWVELHDTANGEWYTFCSGCMGTLKLKKESREKGIDRPNTEV